MLGNDSEVKDPAARAEITAIRNDPQHPYSVGNHPAHDKAVAHVTALYKRAYGEGEAAPGGGSPGLAPDRMAAEARLQDILANTDWLAGRHKDQDALTREYQDLNRRLHPSPDDEPSGNPRRPTQADKAARREAPSDLDPDTGEPIPPAPDPHLAPVWHDPEFREFTSEAGTLGMPAPEVSRWLQYAGRAMREEPPDPEAILETLREEWGQDFNRNLLAARVATKRLGPAFKDFLKQTALGDDPNVIRRMAQLGAPLLRVADEIDKIDSAGREHPFWDDRHPGHARAVQERTKLYRALYGDR